MDEAGSGWNARKKRRARALSLYALTVIVVVVRLLGLRAQPGVMLCLSWHVVFCEAGLFALFGTKRRSTQIPRQVRRHHARRREETFQRVSKLAATEHFIASRPASGCHIEGQGGTPGMENSQIAIMVVETRRVPGINAAHRINYPPSRMQLAEERTLSLSEIRCYNFTPTIC